MNGDIANMVVNVGEQLDKVNWLDAGVTFTSVFLGAFLAYHFNVAIEWRKNKRKMRGDFCSLVTQIHLNFDEMIKYKEVFLDKIFKAYEEQNIDSFLSSISGPSISFAFDLEKYIFLNDCNRCFISELNLIQSTFDILQKRWAFYTEKMNLNYQFYKDGDKDKISEIKRIFTENYDLYTKLCIRLYYLDKHFNKCYERFFNVNYYDNLEEDFESNKELLKSIPNALTDNTFIKMDEYFNKFWAPDYTLWESVKYHYRKIKYHLKGLKIYFFGRGKPKVKCKNEGKK